VIYRCFTYWSSIARGSVVAWGTLLQTGRLRVRLLTRSLNFFSLSNPSSRKIVLGSTQPLTEMSTRNLPGGGEGGTGAEGWQPHRHLWADCLENVGASTSHNPTGFHGLLQGWLYLFFFLWRYSPHLGLDLPPWNFPFHFSLLDLGHSVGLLGRVISSSQGWLYLYLTIIYLGLNNCSVHWVKHMYINRRMLKTNVTNLNGI
jgi:hypothetical protein